MELRRVLWNKRNILLLIGILILNGFLFIRVQSASRNSLSTSIDYYSQMEQTCEAMDDQTRVEYLTNAIAVHKTVENIILYPAYAEKELEQLNMDDVNALKIDMNSITDESIQDRLTDLSLLLEEAEHVQGYQDSIQGVFQRLEQLSQFRIFADTSSFSYKETKKAVSDFEALADVSITFGNTRTFTAFMDHSYTSYFLLLYLIVLVFSFFDERKKGLWITIHTMSHGRETLTLRRMGILLLSDILAVLICYGEILILSVAYYGDMNGAQMLQSIPAYGNFIYPMTIWQFLLLFTIVKIFSLLAVLFLVWLLFSIITHKNVSFLIVGLITAVEYSCFRWIPAQSIAAIFKYMNLYYDIDQADLYQYYRNLNLFGTPVGRLQLFAILLLIMLLVCGGLILVVNGLVRPINEAGMLDKLLAIVTQAWQKLIHRLPGFWMEGYKILVWQKGIWILILFLIITITSIKKPTFTYKQSQGYMKEFYESCAGKTVEEAQEYVDEFEAQMQKDSSNGNSAAVSNLKMNALSKMKERIQYITEQQEKEVSASFVDDTGYQRTFLGTGSEQNRYMDMKILLFLIVLIAGIFPFERKNDVQKLLATSKGRNQVFRMKCGWILMISLLVCGIQYGIQIAQFQNLYGFCQLGSSIKSIPSYQYVPLNCNIGTFLVLGCLIRYLLILSISFVVIVISLKLSQERSMLLGLFLFLLPEVLLLLGLKVADYVSMIRVTDYFGFLSKVHTVPAILVPFVIITIGVYLSRLTKEKWFSVSR